jgi:hypothetical protein
MVEISKILKQALQITKKYKFLWIFGLFLILGNIPNFVLSLSDQSAPASQSVSSNSTSENILGVVLIVLLIVLIALYFRSKAGIISAVKAIVDKEDTSFRKSFAASRLYYSRILLLTLSVFLVFIILGYILVSPVTLLWSQGHTNEAWTLGVFAAVIGLPVLILGLLIDVFGATFIVVFDQTFFEATNKAFKLISENLFKVLILGFVLLLVRIVAFVLLILLDYYIHSLALGVTVLLVFFVVQMLIEVFCQTAWTLFFLDLIKPKKLEEAEVVPAAEAI